MYTSLLQITQDI